MFTIKYRYFMPATEPGEGVTQARVIPGSWIEHEQVWGPFEFVTKEADVHGNPMIYGHYQPAPGTSGGLPMTFGPIQGAGDGEPSRPTAWVMNEQGATIAKYDL